MQPNKIRPTNRLEAIKWNYYNSDSWDFIKIRYWPRDIAKAVISKNLSYVMLKIKKNNIGLTCMKKDNVVKNLLGNNNVI